jgi:hypothetical protein
VLECVQGPRGHSRVTVGGGRAIARVCRRRGEVEARARARVSRLHQHGPIPCDRLRYSSPTQLLRRPPAACKRQRCNMQPAACNADTQRARPCSTCLRPRNCCSTSTRRRATANGRRTPPTAQTCVTYSMCAQCNHWSVDSMRTSDPLLRSPLLPAVPEPIAVPPRPSLLTLAPLPLRLLRSPCRPKPAGYPRKARWDILANTPWSARAPRACLAGDRHCCAAVGAATTTF